jgi:hypothetical protein
MFVNNESGIQDQHSEEDRQSTHGECPHGDMVSEQQTVMESSHGDTARVQRIVRESSHSNTASIQQIVRESSYGNTASVQWIVSHVATSEAACAYSSEQVFDDSEHGTA